MIYQDVCTELAFGKEYLNDQRIDNKTQLFEEINPSAMKIFLTLSVTLTLFLAKVELKERGVQRPRDTSADYNPFVGASSATSNQNNNISIFEELSRNKDVCRKTNVNDTTCDKVVKNCFQVDISCPLIQNEQGVMMCTKPWQDNVLRATTQCFFACHNTGVTTQDLITWNV